VLFIIGFPMPDTMPGICYAINNHWKNGRINEN
jgi:hypothetical protein